MTEAAIEAPAWLLDALDGKSRPITPTNGDSPFSAPDNSGAPNDHWWLDGAIPAGQRHAAIAAVAGWGLRTGISRADIDPTVRDVMLRFEGTKYTWGQVTSKVDDIYGRYEAGDPKMNGVGELQGGDHGFSQLALTTAQIRELEPPEFLIDDYLVMNSLTTLYGPSGCGKTFVALDWALHVATGSWWNGHEVKAGPVLYVIAEGGSGVGKRLDAWQAHHHIHDLGNHEPITWIPRAVNLSDSAEVAALCAFTAEVKPVLVVFDTYARCTLGMEENSSKETGLAVANLDQVRLASGACVLSIHHTGVSEQNRGRGSSALRGAMDTELELTGDAEFLSLKVPKQKDWHEPNPLGLRRMGVEDSQVIVPTGVGVVSTDEMPAAVYASYVALTEVAVPGGVSTSVWEESAACSRATFFRHRKRLLDVELVVNVGSETAPRYVPVSEAETAVRLE